MYRAKALRGSVLALSVLYKTLCGYCTSTSSQVRVTDFRSEMPGIYTKFPWFILLCGQCSILWAKHPFKLRNCSQCDQNFFRNLCSPLSHMLLYTWLILIACNDLMTYQGHIACFHLNFLIVYQKYFSLFVSGLHSNIFCLLIPDWFNDVPLVIVVLLWYPLYR